MSTPDRADPLDEEGMPRTAEDVAKDYAGLDLPVGAYVASALEAAKIPCDSGEDVDRFLAQLAERGYEVRALATPDQTEPAALYPNSRHVHFGQWCEPNATPDRADQTNSDHLPCNLECRCYERGWTSARDWLATPDRADPDGALVLTMTRNGVTTTYSTTTDTPAVALRALAAVSCPMAYPDRSRGAREGYVPASPIDVDRLARALHRVQGRNAKGEDCSSHRAMAQAVAVAYRDDRGQNVTDEAEAATPDRAD